MVSTRMKIIQPALLCLIALPLASCGGMGQAAGSLLKTPWNLLKGMTTAVGRTVAQNDSAAPGDGAAIAARGRAIQKQGDYRGRESGASGDGAAIVSQR